jgi:hypothetical protein
VSLCWNIRTCLAIEDLLKGNDVGIHLPYESLNCFDSIAPRQSVTIPGIGDSRLGGRVSIIGRIIMVKSGRRPRVEGHDNKRAVLATATITGSLALTMAREYKATNYQENAYGPFGETKFRCHRLFDSPA